MEKKTSYGSLNTLMISFSNAFKGISEVFGRERNMKIHMVLACTAIILGITLHLSRPEWIMIILCIGLVFTVEIINTAIERIVDLLSPEKKELAGKAKDISAGAVLIAAITASIIGLIIFIPHLLM